MKKRLIIHIIFTLIIGMLFINTNINVCAAANESSNENYSSERAIDENTESKVIQIKDNASKSLADYQDKYGSNVYGLVAYILNLLRIYSIPCCFLGIAIGAIYQYVIGIRKLDTQSKGLGLMVSFTTILIICQILPLAFAVFVKFGRG